ncbi:MAG: hypothetical protein WC491_08100 [Candidatus Omnitrophota bacterium]|jgi:hypothetical protein
MYIVRTVEDYSIVSEEGFTSFELAEGEYIREVSEICDRVSFSAQVRIQLLKDDEDIICEEVFEVGD